MYTWHTVLLLFLSTIIWLVLLVFVFPKTGFQSLLKQTNRESGLTTTQPGTCSFGQQRKKTNKREKITTYFYLPWKRGPKESTTFEHFTDSFFFLFFSKTDTMTKYVRISQTNQNCSGKNESFFLIHINADSQNKQNTFTNPNNIT